MAVRGVAIWAVAASWSLPREASMASPRCAKAATNGVATGDDGDGGRCRY